MNITDCRKKFQSGVIDKPSYIDAMYDLHLKLFEYANFIKNTDISSIEIQDNQLIMTQRSSGVKLLCESLDKRMAPIETLNFDFYEQADSNMIFNLLNPNMVFFDIGSNIGWYTINIAKRYPNIQIYAFEPIPQTFQILEKNISLNQLKNVSFYNIGFSNSNQEMTFFFNPLASGNASAKNLSEEPNIQKIISRTEKLDDFFNKNKLQQLDFIKCDVEGAELFVYQGAIETLKKCKPIIFTEMLRKWSAKFEYHPNEIIKLLKELGYRCFTTKNGKLNEFYVMDENTIETNFFFLHYDKHANQIQQWTK